jgi:hypothetical protein
VSIPVFVNPQRINLTYCLNQCAAIFGIANMFPSTKAINECVGVHSVFLVIPVKRLWCHAACGFVACDVRQFGGAFPSEDNTFYSNGSDDPWQRAAVAKVATLVLCCAPSTPFVIVRGHGCADVVAFPAGADGRVRRLRPLWRFGTVR